MDAFASFSGVVKAIDDFWDNVQGASGCAKIVSVTDQTGSVVNFVVDSRTYFIDGAVLSVGDAVIGFYDPNLPTILIYPPQYHAVVMSRKRINQSVKLDYFDENLISSDGTLKLNIARATRTSLTNGQPFTANLGNHNLAVVYGFTTRSIPAQTTPRQVIVLC
ncbi:MAG: hypothetical protein VB119_12920 [Candidatus Metalachnospira sp.]|nr:hypothetical protein [Candidatus Metalachnospira sp.]